MLEPTQKKKLTNIKNIVEKKGDAYIKQLTFIEEQASYYYENIFGCDAINIKANETRYLPPHMDIDIIFKDTLKITKHKILRESLDSCSGNMPDIISDGLIHDRYITVKLSDIVNTGEYHLSEGVSIGIQI